MQALISRENILCFLVKLDIEKQHLGQGHKTACFAIQLAGIKFDCKLCAKIYVQARVTYKPQNRLIQTTKMGGGGVCALNAYILEHIQMVFQ